jgi:hypothetical protein
MPHTVLEEDHPRIISSKFGEQTFDEIVIGWFSSKNVSGGLALRSIFFLILILFVLFFKNYKR